MKIFCIIKQKFEDYLVVEYLKELWSLKVSYIFFF